MSQANMCGLSHLLDKLPAVGTRTPDAKMLARGRKEVVRALVCLVGSLPDTGRPRTL